MHLENWRIKSRYPEEGETTIQNKLEDRCLLMELASSFVEAADADLIDLFFDYITSSLMATEVTSQFEAYYTVSKILKEHSWFCSSRIDVLMDLLLSIKSSVDNMVLKNRLLCFHYLLVHMLKIPLSSANEDLQSVLSCKRRVIALNKKDLANPNIMHRWIRHFDSCKQDCLSINAHSKSSVNELLALVEFKLKEAISKEPTLIVMVVGVPNVGKSALINSIHQIATSRFAVQEKMKRATVGPLPGVTQDIAGYKIANHPSIYVLDTPGVLMPSIPDIETGLKLALTGAIKDSVVGEERLAQYLLALLNTRKTPLHWERLHNEHVEGSPKKSLGRNGNILRDTTPTRRRQLNESDVWYIEDLVKEVQRTLHMTFSQCNANLEEESELESLIDMQLTALQKSFKIPQKASNEARTMVSKRLLALFRIGKLGPFILDNLPNAS